MLLEKDVVALHRTPKLAMLKGHLAAQAKHSRHAAKVKQTAEVK